MKYSLKIPLCLSLAALCALSFTPRLQAGEALTAFFPQATQYKGGFSSYGGSKVEVRKESGIVFVENTRPVGLVYWFANHKPLPKEVASLWQNAMVRLELRSVNAPVSLDVSAAWRGQPEPPKTGPASKTPASLEQEWTTVDIPLPDFSPLEGDKLTGLVFQFSKAGAYEIRSIEILGQEEPASAEPTPKPAPPTTQKAPPQEADVAAIKVTATGEPNATFLAAHERNVQRARKGNIGCLFLGDSIILGWGTHKDLWDRHFGAYQPANFGVGGDGTQHLLWRLENGELDGINPKAVVLMIGTNNTNWHDSEATTRGVIRVVETIRKKLPSTKILLLGALPRGEKPNPYRAKNERLNEALKALDDGQNVVFLDMSENFLQPDGSISKDIMPDYLHLSRAGYEIWADAMSPALAKLMQ